MSGDMNTALGNCLLMTSLVYGYCKHIGVTKFRLMNDGDDCVLFIERKDYKKTDNLQEWFLRFGFSMKREEPVYVFEEIEFCQSQPVFISENNPVMIRKPAISIPKDCLSIIPLSTEKLAKRWCRAVAECGISLTSGMPVVQHFYQCFESQTRDVVALKGDPTQDTGMSRMAKGMYGKFKEPTSYARFSFWKAFGICPDKQRAIERYYRNLQLKFTISKGELRPPVQLFL